MGFTKIHEGQWGGLDVLIRDSMGTLLAAMHDPVVTRGSNLWGVFKDG